MKTRISWLSGLMVLGVAAVWMLAGCEANSSADREIDITPKSVGLTNAAYWTVTFFADGSGDSTNMSVKATTTNDLPTAADNDRLYYPLEWSVSNPYLGMILSSTGNSAVYQSNARVAGVNIVTCRDQSGREGQASVTLTFPPPEEEAAEP